MTWIPGSHQHGPGSLREAQFAQKQGNTAFQTRTAKQKLELKTPARRSQGQRHSSRGEGPFSPQTLAGVLPSPTYPLLPCLNILVFGQIAVSPGVACLVSTLAVRPGHSLVGAGVRSPILVTRKVKLVGLSWLSLVPFQTVQRAELSWPLRHFAPLIWGRYPFCCPCGWSVAGSSSSNLPWSFARTVTCFQ